MQRNQKKNSSQKKAKREMRAAEVENYFKLGHCASKYALSLANPFTGPPDACMPVTPACLTRKVRTFLRTQCNIGTAGVGFVAMQPLAGNNGVVTGGSIGTAAVYVSGSTYAGPSTVAIPDLNPTTTGVVPFNHNGDYTIGSFATNGVQARLVSMGLRVRYAGTELNRGGRVILLEDPEHVGFGSVTGLLNLGTMLAYEKSKEHKVGTDWISLCSTGPVVPQEFDFVPSAYTPFAPATPSGNGCHYLVAFLQGTAGNVFDVECYWNFEYTGSVVRGKSYSEADDHGAAVVLGAIKSVNDNQLDSRHPLVNAKSAVAQAQNLNSLVQAYSRKNTSGFFSRAVQGIEQFAGKASPYLEKGMQIGEAVLPLLSLL